MTEEKKHLQFEQKNVYKEIDSTGTDEIFEFCEGYKAFLNEGKTERMCAAWGAGYLKDCGFEPYLGNKLEPGKKYYMIYKNKVTVAFVAGKVGLDQGVNIVVSHVDSPRLDLKPHPFYEDNDICLMKTHYYGGVKKYQWTTIPLMLTGVIIRRDGTKVEIRIGDCDDDPIFYISDLLPHLASNQMNRKLREGVKGEELNVLAGTIPFLSADEKKSDKGVNIAGSEVIKNPVKENILKLLNERYDIEEEDLITAELTLVPAFKARDAGLDRSMVAGYGQDDKVCAYTSMKAVGEIENPERTTLCVWADKEEIGSMGTTGMQSDFLVNFLNKLALTGKVSVFDVIENSMCLSADVDAAYDPTYSSVYDIRNSAKLGNGIVLTKYTGAGGKSGSSDAPAEFAGKIRKIFNDAGVIWQMGELGKVDQGGGGTVAQFIANKGIDTIDCGVAVISMHAPYEIVSKADVYMAYKGYKAFMETK